MRIGGEDSTSKRLTKHLNIRTDLGDTLVHPFGYIPPVLIMSGVLHLA
jgi:hypothetical protein